MRSRRPICLSTAAHQTPSFATKIGRRLGGDWEEGRSGRRTHPGLPSSWGPEHRSDIGVLSPTRTASRPSPSKAGAAPSRTALEDDTRHPRPEDIAVAFSSSTREHTTVAMGGVEEAPRRPKRRRDPGGGKATLYRRRAGDRLWRPSTARGRTDGPVDGGRWMLGWGDGQPVGAWRRCGDPLRARGVSRFVP